MGIEAGDDIIDSRDIEARINDLEGEDELGEDERDELASLLALREKVRGVTSEWSYGVTLINDAYFEEYARDFAEDTGAISRKASWPYTCIDWSAAADELRQDYARVEFCGVEYWVQLC
jgi:hypothetical protein